MGAYEGPTNFLNVGAAPSLMLNFAREKSLEDQISGKDLITFLRSSVGTYVGADGLIKTAAADEPRFDHDPETGESLGLLIEESRTNIAPYGNDMSNYGSANMIKTANDDIAPDGTSTATRVEPAFNGPNNWYLDYSVGILSAGAGTYTYSVWVKAPDDQPDNYYGCRIAILNTTGGNTELTFPIGKTWRRISITKTYGASDPGSIRIHPIIFRALPGNAYDGYVVPDYVHVWGSQWEQASFPTSYIPTSGSTVTRQPDNAQITGTNFTDWYNATEGTIFTESNIYSLESSQNFTEFQIDDGTQTNRIFHYFAQSNEAAKFQAWGSDVSTQDNSAIVNTDLKHASSYNSSSYITCLNSSLSSTGTTGTQVALNEAHIGWNHSSNYLNGHLKQLIYYPARISDIKLQQMTKVFS